MAELSNYTHYRGRHPVTGSVANALAHQRVRAPHTGAPLTEALLAGIAGGPMIGVFSFDYENHDPQVNIVTRNSFGGYGYEALRERLGVRQEIYQTTSASKARENLVAILESDEVPIVTADVFSLAYEASDLGSGMWSMQPMVVSRYVAGDTAELADRARVPLTVPADRFDAARGVVKKDRYRITTLDGGDISPEALASAVRAGIAQCRALYTDKPPAGSASNFGFRALEGWSSALRHPAGKTSWHKRYPGGRRLFAALSSAYTYAALFWKDESETADRLLHAAFLDEAAAILERPGLRAAAAAYREAGAAWRDLSHALLPDGEPILAEERRLQLENHRLFLDSGTAPASTARRREIAVRREELRDRSSSLAADERSRTALFATIADAIDRVLERERAALEALTAADI